MTGLQLPCFSSALSTPLLHLSPGGLITSIKAALIYITSLVPFDLVVKFDSLAHCWAIHCFDGKADVNLHLRADQMQTEEFMTCTVK